MCPMCTAVCCMACSSAQATVTLRPSLGATLKASRSRTFSGSNALASYSSRSRMRCRRAAASTPLVWNSASRLRNDGSPRTTSPTQ